mgnify:CR=1 FL=1
MLGFIFIFLFLKSIFCLKEVIFPFLFDLKAYTLSVLGSINNLFSPVIFPKVPKLFLIKTLVNFPSIITFEVCKVPDFKAL